MCRQYRPIGYHAGRPPRGVRIAAGACFSRTKVGGFRRPTRRPGLAWPGRKRIRRTSRRSRRAGRRVIGRLGGGVSSRRPLRFAVSVVGAARVSRGSSGRSVRTGGSLGFWPPSPAAHRGCFGNFSGVGAECPGVFVGIPDCGSIWRQPSGVHFLGRLGATCGVSTCWVACIRRWGHRASLGVKPVGGFCWGVKCLWVKGLRGGGSAGLFGHDSASKGSCGRLLVAFGLG